MKIPWPFHKSLSLALPCWWHLFSLARFNLLLLIIPGRDQTLASSSWQAYSSPMQRGTDRHDHSLFGPPMEMRARNSLHAHTHVKEEAACMALLLIHDLSRSRDNARSCPQKSSAFLFPSSQELSK